jgi:hypothetical protein
MRGFFERRGREGYAEIAEEDRKEYKNKIQKFSMQASKCETTLFNFKKLINPILFTFLFGILLYFFSAHFA